MGTCAVGAISRTLHERLPGKEQAWRWRIRSN